MLSGSESPASDPDRNRAENEEKRAASIDSDEQTVNVCLEMLLMALCWSLDSLNRIRSDRLPLRLPKGDGEYLYEARVDGLIMHESLNGHQAFIEVKRKLRSGNRAVMRQVTAQMQTGEMRQILTLLILSSGWNRDRQLV